MRAMWDTAAVGTGVVVAGIVLAALAAVGGYAVQRSRRVFKALSEDHPPESGTAVSTPPTAVRLTTGALRGLPVPWRVVPEIAPERLTGAEHVIVGPPGAFAVVTTLDPLPTATEEHEPGVVARAAMLRGGLDDALARVRLASTGVVSVHWGSAPDDAPAAVAGVHGVTHVDGRRLTEWAAALDGETLTASQIDLAWQSVVTSIGRPDPLPDR